MKDAVYRSMNTKPNDKAKVLNISCSCGHAHKPKLSSKVVDDKFLDALAAKQGVKRFKR